MFKNNFFNFQAPCEAEAQCAALVKAGKVFATATEDMDALTFGANVLLRRLTFSEARKLPVQEFHFDKVLQGLELNKDEVCLSFLSLTLFYSLENIFLSFSSGKIINSKF